MAKRSRFPLLLAALIVVGGGSAAAHYTYVMPEAFTVTSGGTITVGFHSGDGFPDSSTILKRLQSPTIKGEGGTFPIEGVREDGKRLIATVRVPSGSHVIVTAVNASSIEQMKGPSFEKYLATWRLHTIAMVRVHEADIDWERFWTTLTFEVAGQAGLAASID